MFPVFIILAVFVSYSASFCVSFKNFFLLFKLWNKATDLRPEIKSIRLNKICATLFNKNYHWKSIKGKIFSMEMEPK
jgi:hypothetical protein